MRRLLLKASLVAMAFTAYVCSPFLTAWFIREAVRNGDSAYLERAIDWPSVRQTLKPSLSRIALDLPDAATMPGEGKASLWKRVKAYFAQGAVNRAIDSYITPEGLSQLFKARKLYRDYVSGAADESLLPMGERVQKAWSRVKRAEFTGLTTFEIEMADRLDENRIYLGKLEFTGLGWTLKELRVRLQTDAATASVQRFSDLKPNAATKVNALSLRRFSPGFISSAEAAPLSEVSAPAVSTKNEKQGFWARARAAAHTRSYAIN